MRILLGLIFVGCNSVSGGGGGHPDAGTQHMPDAPSTGSGGGNVIPRIGNWYYEQVTLVSNTCNAQLVGGEQGAFVIDGAQATSFHVVPNDGGDPFTCTLANGAFDCPNRAAGTIDYRPSVDALVRYHLDANGTFSDAAHGAGSQVATVACAGTQCTYSGYMFPCTYMQSFQLLSF